MKRYFLQILGLALAISPIFGQSAVQSNNGNSEDLAIVSADAGRNTDAMWLMEARAVNYTNDVVGVEATEPMEADALFVYPNPSKGVVQLKLTGKISVYVYTLSGQFVQKNYMAPGEKILDLSTLPAGVYHIMAKSDDDYFSGKLIIQ